MAPDGPRRLPAVRRAVRRGEVQGLPASAGDRVD